GRDRRIGDTLSLAVYSDVSHIARMAFPDSVDTPLPRVLPRGPHGLAREVVQASQRARMLDAMAEAVAEKGYGAVSVADVIARAGVSRKTFNRKSTRLNSSHV